MTQVQHGGLHTHEGIPDIKIVSEDQTSASQVEIANDLRRPSSVSQGSRNSDNDREATINGRSNNGNFKTHDGGVGGELRSRLPNLQLRKHDSPSESLNSGPNSPETRSEKSDLLSNPPSPFRDNSKWLKLRTTVKVAGAVTTVNKHKKTRKQSTLVRQDSFLKRFSTRHGGGTNNDEESDEDFTMVVTREEEIRKKLGRYVVHPDENFMFYWLGICTLVVLYNLWTCIARQAFKEIEAGYEPIWFCMDGICDFVYLTDIVVQLRTGYLEKGLIVYDSKKLALHYTRSLYFKLDIITLLPLDFIQFWIGIHPIIRFPRFLKAYRMYRFTYMVETRTHYPNMWRVANLSHVLFLGSHWFAAFYFMISEAEGFKGHWGYPTPVGPFASVTRKYLKSLYWSTLTLTTIGDLPPPESNWEYVFTIVSYLIGVFVFATIVGQVGSVITNRNASRQEFERLLDGAKSYMRNHNVPMDMQRRVQRWYDYAWSRGRMNGGGDINSLGLLPDKLKTELALHVNLETLKKVTIFQECEPEFLHDLVLKMRAFIFTPGDLICRKGEVAREMFIIADGLLEVISDSGEVLTQMSAGDFFGEIGILNLDGGVNRRTADVRSVGYSELFVLSRDDVLSALKDHPEAEAILTQHGRKRLIGIRLKNKEVDGQGRIRSLPNTIREEEANPSPITNLLGVRISGSKVSEWIEEGFTLEDLFCNTDLDAEMLQSFRKEKKPNAKAGGKEVAEEKGNKTELPNAPCLNNGDIIRSASPDDVESQAAEAESSGNPTSHASSTRRRLSRDTVETALLGSSEGESSSESGSPIKRTRPNSPQECVDHGNPRDFWTSPSKASNLKSRGSITAKNLKRYLELEGRERWVGPNPGPSRTRLDRTGSCRIYRERDRVPPVRSSSDCSGSGVQDAEFVDPVFSSDLDCEIVVQGAGCSDPDPVAPSGELLPVSSQNVEDDAGELVGVMKSLLENKLGSYQEQYEHHIQQLEEENRSKEQRIRQLENKLQTLQRALLFGSGGSKASSFPPVDQ